MSTQQETNSFNLEQGRRSRNLFSAVVLAALNEAIIEHSRQGTGRGRIARWARTSDGRQVLSCAGINPSERVVSGLMTFVIEQSRAQNETKFNVEHGRN